MFKKLKEKKGFTLVELIVVLVILAILAALTGYINKAKDKQIIAETRQTVMAAQTLVDEAYAKDSSNAITVAADGTVKFAEVYDLAEVDGTIEGTVTVSNKGKITSLTYKNSGKQCTYTVAEGKTKGTYTVAE